MKQRMFTKPLVFNILMRLGRVLVLLASVVWSMQRANTISLLMLTHSILPVM